MPKRISAEVKKRLKAVRLVIADVDGVLTTGGIVLDERGKELKIFHARDGSGAKYLKRFGIKTALLSGRPCRAVERRAKMLEMDVCVTGAKEKLPAYRKILKLTGVSSDAVCYIGDDLPDIPPMRAAGIAVAVADAADEVKRVASFVTKAPGGQGAYREVAELILKAQGKWAKLMERYIS